MKQLFILAIMTMLLVTAASAQNAATPTKTRYTCSATKADGAQCRSIVKAQGAKCTHHDEKTVRCGQPTAKGTACRMPVKAAGAKCWRHQ